MLYSAADLKWVTLPTKFEQLRKFSSFSSLHKLERTLFADFKSAAE